MSFEAKLYLFNHIFLPPKLPQAADDSSEYERLLLDKVLEALEDFNGHVHAEDAGAMTTAITMLSRLKAMFGFNGDVDEGALLKALAQLEAEGKHIQG